MLYLRSSSRCFLSLVGALISWNIDHTRSQRVIYTEVSMIYPILGRSIPTPVVNNVSASI